MPRQMLSAGSKADPGILLILRYSEACKLSFILVICGELWKTVISLCNLGHCFESTFFEQYLHMLLAKNKGANDNFISWVLQMK